MVGLILNQMIKYDKVFGQQYLDALLKKHKIKVVQYSAGSCGWAKCKTREIKIPKPTNLDRFGVCLHEIKHIIDGSRGKKYDKEFTCDKYVLDIFKELNLETDKWEKRMRWHSLSRIAMAFNRGGSLNNIKEEIKQFFKEIDFNQWRGKKVFVHHSKTESFGYRITYTENFTKDEIEMFLNRQGLMLSKSFTDDSTFGQWRVNSNQDQYGNTFDNLPEIVQHYNLGYK